MLPDGAVWPQGKSTPTLTIYIKFSLIAVVFNFTGLVLHEIDYLENFFTKR